MNRNMLQLFNKDDNLSKFSIRFLDWTSVSAFLAVAAYGVFCMPYQFPTTVPIASESYAAGFNNRVGVLATLVVIGLFCARGLFWRSRSPELVESLVPADPRTARRFPRMPKSVLFLLIAIHLAVTISMYFCIPHLDEFGETIGFLPRFEGGLRYHLQLYEEIDWPYGPGLFYVPQLFIAAAGWMGATPDLGVIVCFCCIWAVADWILFFVVDAFRLKVTYRVLILSMISLCCNSSLGMGLQYSMLRFGPPYALLLIVHQASARMKSPLQPKAILKLCSLCLLGGLVGLAISTEAGIACIVALCAYFGHRVWFGGRGWIWPPVAALGSLPIMWLLFPGSFRVLVGFAAGGNNFPIYPSVHIVFYLLSLFWLLPILLRPCATRQPADAAPFLLGWAAVIVCMIPAALGRCDGGHVMFNGIGAFLFAMVILAKYHPRLFPVYAISFFFLWGILGWAIGVTWYSHGMRPPQLASADESAQPDSTPSKVADALGLKDFSSIAVPMGLDRATKRFLIEAGIYVPQCHPDYGNVFTPQELKRKIDSSRRAAAVLVPEWVPQLRSPSDEDIGNWRRANLKQLDVSRSLWMTKLFLYPIDFRTKYLPFDPLLEEARYIASCYHPVRHKDGWVVMVRDATSETSHSTESDTPEPPMTPQERAATRAASK